MSDTTDDMEALAAVAESDFDIIRKREGQWEEGYHIDRQGNRHELSKMTSEHLRNTINFFIDYDHSPLEEELAKRQ